MPSIDLNCDLGESFGAYTIGMDAEILPYVTSANIACGFHAGDPSVMQKSVLLCKKYGVAGRLQGLAGERLIEMCGGLSVNHNGNVLRAIIAT